MNFRRAHTAELETDPAFAAKVPREFAAIEKLRRTTGVSGQSTQLLYVDPRWTF
jgi:hypothetical protein